jgi:hypothetical protein
VAVAAGCTVDQRVLFPSEQVVLLLMMMMALMHFVGPGWRPLRLQHQQQHLLLQLLAQHY